MKTNLFRFLLVLLLFTGCAKQVDLSEKVYNQGINLIPMPQKMELVDGKFTLDNNTSFYVTSDEAKAVAAFYAEKMKNSTGYNFTIKEGEGKGIQLVLDNKVTQPEGYLLSVRPEGVTVTASTAQGLFYGMASFMQLLPAEIESPTVIPSALWTAQAVEIEDWPLLPYRGLMIDVARHFTSKEGMKKHIDMLATLKINNLHLHLSDYQGWRVEIKKYPKLTEVGATRIDAFGNVYEGFYTQDDIRELVQYATERHVNIIPEIDVPGHTLAAIAAYPELSCTGEQYEVMRWGGGFPVVFCPGKEVMFEFMDDIFAELSELFPSEYFHIGGDECPKEVWKTCPHCQKRIKDEGIKADKRHPAEHKLQSYAITRCEDILKKHGKKMIGWDEILEGGLAPDATVMSWRGEAGGIESALMGHNVIMTPNSGGMYFDHYQGDPQAEDFSWGAYAPITLSYNYNPIPDTLVTMGKDHFIHGVQGNVWSECMYTEDIVENRVYPRVLAVAETGWTQVDLKDFEDFSRRLNNAAVRMDLHDINYHIPFPEQVGGSINHVAFLDETTQEFTTTRPMKIVYTVDGSEPTLNSTEYTTPITFNESTTLKLRSVLPSGVMSPVRVVELEKQTMREPANVEPKNKGLKLKIADEKCVWAKDIENVTQWKDSVITKIDVISKLRPNFYADVRFYVAIADGFMHVEEDGIYEFRSDNTRVWVDGELVVDNDGKAQVNSKYGRSLALKKGWYPFKVEQISNFIGGWNSQHRNHGQVTMRKYGEKKFKRIDENKVGY